MVPIVEEAHWIDLDPDLNRHLMGVSQAIGKAQHAAFGCERVGMIIAGYEVPHVHLHVIPTTSMAQLDFRNQGSATPEALEAAAAKIRAELRAAGHPEVAG